MSIMRMIHLQKAFLFAFATLLQQGVVMAQQIPVLDFFHGRECPHCHEEKEWFATLKQMYPDIQINEYEVWHDVANQKIWTERMQALDMSPSGVPTNIIGDEVVVGFVPDQILTLLEARYGPPLEVDENVVVETTEEPKGMSSKIVFIILGAALLIGGALFVGRK